VASSKRVSIARLSFAPTVVLADEPTGNLDSSRSPENSRVACPHLAEELNRLWSWSPTDAKRPRPIADLVLFLAELVDPSRSCPRILSRSGTFWPRDPQYAVHYPLPLAGLLGRKLRTIDGDLAVGCSAFSRWTAGHARAHRSIDTCVQPSSSTDVAQGLGTRRSQASRRFHITRGSGRRADIPHLSLARLRALPDVARRRRA